MDKFTRIKKEFQGVLKAFEESTAMKKILSGEMIIDHYKSYLRRTYHYTINNPQIQALATVYFTGSNRHIITSRICFQN